MITPGFLCSVLFDCTGVLIFSLGLKGQYLTGLKHANIMPEKVLNVKNSKPSQAEPKASCQKDAHPLIVTT
jgi:hypothetical protein